MSVFDVVYVGFLVLSLVVSFLLILYVVKGLLEDDDDND